MPANCTFIIGNYSAGNGRDGGGLSRVRVGEYNRSNVTSLTPSSTVLTNRTQSFPLIPFAFTGLLLAFIGLPRVHDNPRLAWSLAGAGGALLVWELILWARTRAQNRSLTMEFAAVKSHYVQASVQFCIMLYWGWYAPTVFKELPLVFAQLLFLYSLEALLTWSRGKTWRLGFGPMPIIFSTNLLLWFKDDWYFLQFAMITIGALGKQFITWERDGKRTHIFNPSAFGQSVIAYGLIFAGMTNHMTWGREIATTFEAPHMLIVIFALGLVVQYMFHVTLMTVSAVAALFLINLVYTQVTGTYVFISTNIAAPIFLGVHLLVTDPATSPKSNLGRVVFGALYGLGYAVLFQALALIDVPLFWDKLLPVPFLNLMVPLIDRACRSGFIGRANARWTEALSPKRLNLVHMALWAAFFFAMAATGFIESDKHPGNSVTFWKKALAEGKPHAGHSLVILTGGMAKVGNVGPAYNELGVICMDGRVIPENRPQAALYFAKACQLGDASGCMNVAQLYLFLNERRTDRDVGLAFDRLEAACAPLGDDRYCCLIGLAYETGRGRPQDPIRAMKHYGTCRSGNAEAAKGICRIRLSGQVERGTFEHYVRPLEAAASAGDAESCWILAYIYKSNRGVPRDDARSRAFLEQACRLGMKQACDATALPELPPFTAPHPGVPAWATAYPIDG